MRRETHTDVKFGIEPRSIIAAGSSSNQLISTKKPQPNDIFRLYSLHKDDVNSATSGRWVHSEVQRCDAVDARWNRATVAPALLQRFFQQFAVSPGHDGRYKKDDNVEKQHIPNETIELDA